MWCILESSSNGLTLEEDFLDKVKLLNCIMGFLRASSLTSLVVRHWNIVGHARQAGSVVGLVFLTLRIFVPLDTTASLEPPRPFQ